ncbi:MAG: histidine phosphatase family protein [Betaproteobacteria bacterium]|nr:histidine phosphatase family protein [Betaproteobacteria bacterium]
MSLLIIRHGETPLNVTRVLQPADTPLSANGQAQAEALALALKSVGLAAILSSDLPRALQTAQAIGRACGLPVLTTALLHERNFGDLRGRAYDTLDHDPLTAEGAAPGGESQVEFRQRCAAAWALLRQHQTAAGGPLAVVTHGLVIREWLWRGPLLLPDGMAPPEHLANTSLTLASAAPPHRVSKLNNTDHLDDRSAVDSKSLSGG